MSTLGRRRQLTLTIKCGEGGSRIRKIKVDATVDYTFKAGEITRRMKLDKEMHLKKGESIVRISSRDIS